MQQNTRSRLVRRNKPDFAGDKDGEKTFDISFEKHLEKAPPYLQKTNKEGVCMENTLQFIEENKVIVICRKVYGDQLIQLLKALKAGGVKMIEVTFDQADPDCIRKTSEAISLIRDTFHGEILPGAGTVLTREQVRAAVSAGAKYIISPNVDLDVIDETLKLGCVSIPGAATPTEIQAAHKAGAHLVKLFPAGALGFRYIKDILAPISHVKLLATGGVTEENLPDYLSLGFVGAGVSGRLCDKKLMAEGNFEEITRRAAGFQLIAQGGSKK